MLPSLSIVYNMVPRYHPENLQKFKFKLPRHRVSICHYKMDFSAGSREWACRVMAATTRSSIQREFRGAWEQLLEQPLNQIRQEYGSAHEFMCRQGLSQKALDNLPCSRYSNILPFDRHAVSLSNGGYINASWILFPNLSSIASPFIIAQGPMHPDFYGVDTTAAFWQMVLEHRAKAVVNLAKVEPGFSGCARYWPSNDDKATAHDGRRKGLACKPLSENRGEDLVVTVEKCEELEPGLWRRIVSLHRQRDKTSSTDIHQLEHFHFEKWPNYDVATEGSATVNLLSRIVQIASIEEGEGNGPVVVHCSGGVGRSGTFVAAAATLLSCSKCTEWSTVKYAEHVALMRKQRHPWMVEGFEQFHFGARLASRVILQSNTHLGTEHKS